jgi:SAM-dependent methyltransferase
MKLRMGYTKLHHSRFVAPLIRRLRKLRKYDPRIYKLKKLLMKFHKNGLEIGGPTQLLSEIDSGLDIYKLLNLDGLNIPLANPFQRELKNEYAYGEKFGKQYSFDIANQENFTNLPKYDLIVMSHVIEHFANPIKILKDVQRSILSENGMLLSIIPDYRHSFDRNRKLTTLSHIITDYQDEISERDMTHIEEILEQHDFKLCGMKNWKELILDNYNTRVAHHHTFNPSTYRRFLDHCGFKTLLQFKIDKLNIVNLSISRIGKNEVVFMD